MSKSKLPDFSKMQLTFFLPRLLNCFSRFYRLHIIMFAVIIMLTSIAVYVCLSVQANTREYQSFEHAKQRRT
jgi:hypothetical protein